MARLLAVGHVTRDELPDGRHRLGGTVLYAAASAARLGFRSAIVTRVGPHEREELEGTCALLGIELHALGSLVTTTFAFREVHGTRILRLRARAKSVGAADVPETLTSVDALLLGSVARELAPDLFALDGPRVRVLAAQGQLRIWQADGTIHPGRWDEAEDLIRGLSCVVLSREDIGGDAALPERWSHAAPIALTTADHGALLYRDGREPVEVAPFTPRQIVDTTGAGDVFSAGLAVALAEGRSLEDACRHGSALASLRLEGEGLSALPDRGALEERLRG